MRLLWSSRSPFVRKVMIVAHELGLQDRIETTRVVVHPAHPNADVMKINPAGKIPTLIVRDDLVLYDSRVICEYLDATFGSGTLVPGSGESRYRVLTWQALADAAAETALLWLGERSRPEAQRNQEVMSACRLRIWATLDAFETNASFWDDRNLTVAHVALLSLLLYLDFRFAEEGWRNGRTRLDRWVQALSTRTSVSQTHYVDVY